MMVHALHVHAHRLLHQPVFLEAVRVDQRPDECALRVAIEPTLLLEGRRRGRRGRQRDRTAAGDAVVARVRFTGFRRPFAPLRRPLLLTRRERLEQLAVDEEVPEDPTRAPRHPVRPSLDAGGVLFVDEDATAPDELAPFPVMRSSRDVVQDAGQAGLEQQQGVVGRSDMAVEGRLQRPAGARAHVGRQLAGRSTAVDDRVGEKVRKLQERFELKWKGRLAGVRF